MTDDSSLPRAARALWRRRKRERMSSIRVLTLVAVHDARRMSERELDELIAEGEEAAFAGGFAPTLAE